MVAAEFLTDYFEAKGHFPYMLEVVKVRESFRDALAAVTHVDGSARVQTVDKQDDPEIYALLLEFQQVSGFPILLNTSFNVRGQPIIEKPQHALEMLLSTQLNGVIFGDILVEVSMGEQHVSLNDVLKYSPNTCLSFVCNESGTHGTLHVRSQGKTINIKHKMCQVLHALDGIKTVGAILTATGILERENVLAMLSRFKRLRYLNNVRLDI